jgi:receptor-type tyrosine-protein phosphatase gamma
MMGASLHFPKFLHGLYKDNIYIYCSLEGSYFSSSSFQLVASFQPKDFNLVSANKPCNQLKNRTLDLLPVESARVHLTPKPGVDGSDYINATWFQGTDILIYKFTSFTINVFG